MKDPPSYKGGWERGFDQISDFLSVGLPGANRINLKLAKSLLVYYYYLYMLLLT